MEHQVQPLPRDTGDLNSSSDAYPTELSSGTILYMRGAAGIVYPGPTVFLPCQEEHNTMGCVM